MRENMYANSEAEEHYTHTIEVSAKLAESARAEAQFRIYEKRAAVYLATGRFDLSIADGREMIQRARTAGSAELECAALYTLGNTLFWAHRLDEMHSTLEDVLRVSAANEVGRLHSEYQDAEQMFRKQIELALEHGDAFEFVKANYSSASRWRIWVGSLRRSRC